MSKGPAIKPRRRPAGFEAVPAGRWLDRAHESEAPGDARGFLDEKVRASLLNMMTIEHSDPDLARAFVSDCDRFAQMVSQSRWRVRQGEQRKQLDAVGHAASAMREAIEALDESVSLYWQRTLKQWERAAGPSTLRLRRKSPLAAVHDMMAVIEEVSELAAGRIDVSRRRRVTDEAATGLASLVLRAFRARFGEYPPTGIDSWFPDFMRDLGAAIGVTCDDASIARALKDDAVNNPVTQNPRTARSPRR